MSKPWGSLRKFVWPSQKSWTLIRASFLLLYTGNLSKACHNYESFLTMIYIFDISVLIMLISFLFSLWPNVQTPTKFIQWISHICQPVKVNQVQNILASNEIWYHNWESKIAWKHFLVCKTGVSSFLKLGGQLPTLPTRQLRPW